MPEYTILVISLRDLKKCKEKECSIQWDGIIQMIIYKNN